jgi:rhodanese-related sulfurtransferase
MLSIVALAGLAALCNSRRFPDTSRWLADAHDRVPGLGWTQVQALGEVLWIDARSREQFDAAHVPGAFWLSEEVWEEKFPELLQHWNPVRSTVVYCDRGGCQLSESLARRLRTAGIQPVYYLRGGWGPELSVETRK